MRRTRIFAVILALLLVLSYGMAGMGGSVSAANTNASRYYYSQLKGDAKAIYDAMYEMYVQGIFKTGTQEYVSLLSYMTSGPPTQGWHHLP